MTKTEQKEDVYLDMKKLTESQRKEVIKLLPVKFNSIDYDVRYHFEFLQYKDNEWCFSIKPNFKTEIYINQFRELFKDNKSNGLELNYIVIDDEMKQLTETEKKLYDYAVSVDWYYYDIEYYISWDMSLEEFRELNGADSCIKAKYFIEEHKHKQPESITLPIDDYNRLRKLEIKKQIKKLKKELKGL